MPERIDIEDLPTGPAADQEDLQGLLGLCRSSQWPTLERHLRKAWQGAENRLMRFNQPQEDGYWKGVKRMCDDLLDLPKNVALQIEGLERRRRDSGKEMGIE